LPRGGRVSPPLPAARRSLNPLPPSPSTSALDRGGALVSEARGCAHPQRFASQFLGAALQCEAPSSPSGASRQSY
jgi:hypothetical protein